MIWSMKHVIAEMKKNQRMLNKFNILQKEGFQRNTSILKESSAENIEVEIKLLWKGFGYHYLNSED